MHQNDKPRNLQSPLLFLLVFPKDKDEGHSISQVIFPKIQQGTEVDARLMQGKEMNAKANRIKKHVDLTHEHHMGGGQDAKISSSMLHSFKRLTLQTRLDLNV